MMDQTLDELGTLSVDMVVDLVADNGDVGSTGNGQGLDVGIPNVGTSWVGYQGWNRQFERYLVGLDSCHAVLQC